MLADDQNPYAAPVNAIQKAPSLGTRWRVIPTALFAFLGGGSSCLGLYLAGRIIWEFLIGEKHWNLGISDCPFFLGIGVLWSMASVLFWTRRYRRGLIATFAGFLTLLVFALLG